jgi:hypothetical protein
MTSPLRLHMILAHCITRAYKRHCNFSVYEEETSQPYRGMSVAGPEVAALTYGALSRAFPVPAQLVMGK